MIGCYDFCGHYEWTFEWLRRESGEAMVRTYWDEAIHQDSQRHASELIAREGFKGMAEYWGHTLNHEGAGYHTTLAEGVFRIDMQVCPSKGFLIQNKLNQYPDYCDHCMGWIGPMLKQGGFAVDHEHNHQGKCWWEIKKATDQSAPSEIGQLAGTKDVRQDADWEPVLGKKDIYRHSNDADDKVSKICE